MIVNLVEELISLVFAIIGLVVSLAVSAVFLLALYGIVVLIFRNAFGVELPNPVNWVPSDWRVKSGL